MSMCSTCFPLGGSGLPLLVPGGHAPALGGPRVHGHSSPSPPGSSWVWSGHHPGTSTSVATQSAATWELNLFRPRSQRPLFVQNPI